MAIRDDIRTVFGQNGYNGRNKGQYIEKPSEEELAAVTAEKNGQNTVKIERMEPEHKEIIDAKKPLSEGFYQRYMDEVRRERDADEARRKSDMRGVKRQRLFAAIGDGLDAFHQAYSKGRGVAPMSPQRDLSGKLAERYDKLRMEDRAARGQYDKRLLELQAADLRDKLAQHNMEKDKEMLKLRQDEQERKVALTESMIKYNLSRVDAIRSKQDYEDRVAEAKIALMQAGVDSKRAGDRAKFIVANSTAAKNYAYAEKAKKGGGSSNGDEEVIEETTYTRDNLNNVTGKKVKKTKVKGKGNSNGKRESKSRL